jgi:hypothetical protein
MAQHRVIITLPDGTVINQLPLNNVELTESLVEDETGAYYYEKSIGKLKYDNTGGVFSAFKSVEDSGDRCEEAISCSFTAASLDASTENCPLVH